MHTCSSCGKTFDSAQTPCHPPTHCDRSNKGFASYQTLWKHKEMYRGQAATHKINYPVGQKQSVDIPTASPELYERPNDNRLRKRLKNPKITNLIDEILNDTSENQSEKERPIVIQVSLPVPTVIDVQPKTNGVMAVGMTKIKSMKTAIRRRPKVDIEMNLSKKSRTKCEIISYSDDDHVDELPFRTK